jgi:hypothetical protein
VVTKAKMAPHVDAAVSQRATERPPPAAGQTGRDSELDPCLERGAKGGKKRHPYQLQ